MTEVIRARGLRKEFTVHVKTGRIRRARRVRAAVDGLDLRVERGEMLGYIGPNGAGKSTTLKMFTGVLTPTAGEVRVCGLRPVAQRTRLALRIGVVFGQRSQLWWDLPLRDSFDLLGHVYRVPAAEHAARLRRCRDLLDLDGFLDVPVRQLSLGQRMRGELTAALLHGPEVLFLDEPTISLDVVSRQAVRGFLAELGSTGDTTLVLTTHDLADIERLCRRLVVADLDAPLPEPPVLPGAPLREVAADGRRLVYALESAGVAEVVSGLAGVASLRDVAVVEPDIEEVVARLYGAPAPAAVPAP
ncbi:ABC transporter ATP-binding protein [Micromonospora globbae]|uniref:ATP-binding cassette domain-containing protein n=1 Tax=Micromonospora globbae TaxID=1894969 RepID=A0A420F5Y8_9ACTN|nr:ATP-binding cassette domain-containing protein [Micromonospora globbae]RKF28343.1 ATP-binding cassette domain-containing protein [Micromonospora globbae]